MKVKRRTKGDKSEYCNKGKLSSKSSKLNVFNVVLQIIFVRDCSAKKFIKNKKQARIDSKYSIDFDFLKKVHLCLMLTMKNK